jgi:hypothetical protein
MTIEDLLQTRQPTKSRTAIAYYYFNFQSKAEQQFVNLLRSIILQLSCQCPNLPTSVTKLSEEDASTFSNERLIVVLNEVAENFRELYIVIDALDECDQSEEVLQWIQKLVENKDGRLHLLISSRPDHHFQTDLKPSTTSVLALDESTFETDIQLYIRERLNNDPRMKKWPSSIHKDVEQSLIANAGGL